MQLGSSELLKPKSNLKCQISLPVCPVYHVLKAAGEPRGRGQEAQQ